MTEQQPKSESKMSNIVVLAFSGGLDTSFCVPYLIEQGYRVHTLFVDSGGVSPQEKASIEARAQALGATQHHSVNIGEALWHQIVTPLVQAGHWYQNAYPLLCSDRYLIVEACLKLCDQLGTKFFAHGCTGMGNDQVRFDLAVQCLGDYKILSPIREIQKITTQVRDYEQTFLKDRGFAIPDKVAQYSINENLLGTTISGSEIDKWQVPSDASYVLTKPSHLVNQEPKTLSLEFKQGQVIAIDTKEFDTNIVGDDLSGEKLSGANLMRFLNQLGGDLGIGRGIYTGDTTIGLKGRIVYECPALTMLNAAHTALEQVVLTKAQNRFKQQVAKQWTELVYEGLFYEPLKQDLEAFIASVQKQVTGKVTLTLSAGQALVVAVDSPFILQDGTSVYAQSAAWTIEEAQGFIKLFGKSTVLACHRSASKVGLNLFHKEASHVDS